MLQRFTAFTSIHSHKKASYSSFTWGDWSLVVYEGCTVPPCGWCEKHIFSKMMLKISIYLYFSLYQIIQSIYVDIDKSKSEKPCKSLTVPPQADISWRVHALVSDETSDTPTALPWQSDRVSLSGAAASVAVGHMSLEWSVWGELVLGGFTFVVAGAIFLMDLTDNIWISYMCYSLFKTVYLQLSTICT